MTTLRVAPGLALPIDYVTKTAAILAQRRKGKTYTGSVLAEELVRLKMPWVALDPTGAWWGLRSSANGKDEGLPVYIVGGQHGDLPLTADLGRAVADLVVDHPSYYVLDLSLLDSRSAERQFSADFAERLYRRKLQPGLDFPLHLFVDEADMFVPQEREQVDTRMLGAFQSIVRRGGLHGLGTTLISQRPALVNKSVLTQLDILILLRLVAGNDVDYLDKNYIKRAGTAEERTELLGSMASLRLGEAWFWEPGAEPPLFQRVQIRERHTFNSSATPKPGERRVEPTRFTEVDLAEIKEEMGESIERAKADDPAELRNRIRDLERRLAAAARVSEPAPAEEIEVPVFDEALGEQFARAVDAMRAAGAEISATVETISAALETAARLGRRGEAPARGTPGRTEPAAGSALPPSDLREPAAGNRTPSPPDDAPDVARSRSGAAILTALAQRPDGVSRDLLALLVGNHPNSKGFANTLGALRSAGLVEPGWPARPTPAGLDAAVYEPLPSGRDLFDYWLRHDRIVGAGREILALLYDAYPGGYNRDTLAGELGCHPNSKGYANAVGRLRSLGLVVRDWPLRLAPDFADALGLRG